MQWAKVLVNWLVQQVLKRRERNLQRSTSASSKYCKWSKSRTNFTDEIFDQFFFWKNTNPLILMFFLKIYVPLN